MKKVSLNPSRVRPVRRGWYFIIKSLRYRALPSLPLITLLLPACTARSRQIVDFVAVRVDQSQVAEQQFRCRLKLHCKFKFVHKNYLLPNCKIRSRSLEIKEFISEIEFANPGFPTKYSLSSAKFIKASTKLLRLEQLRSKRVLAVVFAISTFKSRVSSNPIFYAV